jgi:outer membrane protein insertion porin family
LSHALPCCARTLLLALVWSLAAAPLGATELPRDVVVAVELADTPRAPDADPILVYWMGELERPEPGWAPALEVRVGSVLQVPELGGEAPDGSVWWGRATPEQARLGALARIGRSGSRFSIDMELRDLATQGVLSRFMLVAEGQEGLRGALELAARRLRAAVSELPAVSEGMADQEAEAFVDVLEGADPPGTQAEDPATGTEASAPPASSPGPAQVVDLRVEGNRRIESGAIKAVLSTRPGDPLISRRVGEDVRRIYELGFFRDVQVIAEDVTGGKRVTFMVEENPIIRRVTLSGNDNLDEGDIKEKLTLTVGSTVDYPLLLENRDRISVMYQSKGYYLADVKYEVEPLGEGIVGVNFDVTEGKKLRLRKIEITGNDSIDDDELIGAMQTKRWRWYSPLSRFWDNSGLYAEPIFLGDLDRMSRLYMDQGFIRVAVGKPEVDIDEEGIRVTVDVVEGDQFKVGRIDVLGDETMDREQLAREVVLEPGDVFSRGVLSDDVERLEGYYQDHGFFDAKVSPRTQVKTEDLSIDVSFEVEKGGLFFVDSIDVHGNTRTRDAVVRRELSLAEGELYSRHALRRSQRRVRRLGFFEEVEVEPRRTDEPGRVALDVDVVERPTGAFSFGAGVGSTDGFVITASVRQDNLFGHGRAVNASADVGSRNSRVFVSFVEPYVFGTAARLSTTLSALEREFIDFDEEVQALQLLMEYPLDEGDTTVGAGYSFSAREISDFDGFESASLLQREDSQGDVDTSKVVLSLRRDTRDDIRFPTRGHRTSATFEFAGLGGLTEFLRFELGTTRWIPLKRWLGFESTFVLSAQAGWAIPFNDVSDFDLPPCASADCLAFIAASPEAQPLDQIDDDLELPLTERYFLGGLGSFQLRGFKQRSVGPRRSVLRPNFFSDANDRAYTPVGLNSLFDTDDSDFEDLDDTDIIGGNKFALLNLEMQFPISEELGLKGLVFLDMGNAFAEEDSINPGDFRFGTGAGVQWFSPFGPITIILGIPIDRLEDEDASVFEFSMGGSSL